MDPSKDKKPASPWMAALNPKVLEVGGAVGFVTIFIVLISVFGGLWLDKLLGTKPLLTVSLVLASAPISLIITFWLATRAVKDIHPGQPAGKGSSPPAREGDEE